MGLLDIYPLINIRRNHGLEHATIHILSESMPNLSVVGRSDLGGFTLYGNLDTEAIAKAANEALLRMQAGQAELAVHPRCGTILATTGLLTGFAAFMAVSLSGIPSRRFRWNALPEVVLAATVAAIFSQPLGLVIQENYTVSGQPGNLQIKAVKKLAGSRIVTHRISTSQ